MKIYTRFIKKLKGDCQNYNKNKINMLQCYICLSLIVDVMIYCFIQLVQHCASGMFSAVSKF